MKTSKRITAALLWVGMSLLVSGPSATAEAGDGPWQARTTVQAAQSQVLRSQVSRPATVLFVIPEDTIVEKGDLLVRLDASDLTEQELELGIRVSQARAELAAAEEALRGAGAERAEVVQIAEQALRLAEMSLKGFLDGQCPLELTQAENEMVLAKERFRVAAARASYLEKAAEAGAERELALKEARVALLESELQLKGAEDRIRFLKDIVHNQKKAELELGISQRKLDLYRAKSAVSRAARQSEMAMDVAREKYEMERTRRERVRGQIDACRVRAPRAGTVLYPRQRWGQAGDAPAIWPGVVVRSQRPLLQIVDADRFKCGVPVRPDLARRVETGQKVTVRVDALPSRTFEGRVAEVGPLPHPRGSARNLITVRLDDTSGDLRVGMTAMLEFER